MRRLRAVLMMSHPAISNWALAVFVHPQCSSVKPLDALPTCLERCLDKRERTYRQLKGHTSILCAQQVFPAPLNRSVVADTDDRTSARQSNPPPTEYVRQSESRCHEFCQDNRSRPSFRDGV